MGSICLGNNPASLELIETLWNVNVVVINNFSIGSGINRNIVECKCHFIVVFLRLEPELIETLWNVNEYKEE